MAKKYAFLIDSSRCTGCRACEIACKNENKLPVGPRWRRVRVTEEGSYPNLQVTSLSFSCNHCDEPKCAEICPAGAYTKRSDGLVVHDESKCIGCRYCTMACPYGAPQYNPEADKSGKCRGCVERLDQGLEPACARICIYGALYFGDINDPNSEISRQIIETGAVHIPGTSTYYVAPDGSGAAALPGDFGQPAGVKWWMNVMRPGGKVIMGAAAVAVGASVVMSALRKQTGKDDGS